MNKTIHIVHLYPKEMNIYGDTGNVLVLQKRLKWRGIETTVSHIGVGQEIPSDVDIIVGGGGQDAGQDNIQADLQTKAATLLKMADEGVVMLMICGMYQLFGRSFTTKDGVVIKGIGLLPLETIGGPTRFIGNTIYQTPYGEIVGYENHSGVTTLDDATLALGTVTQGAGNNSIDKTEGCIKNNVFGSYSHGPILTKNPVLADELLLRAVKRKGNASKLTDLDDSLENSAQRIAKQRPR